MFPGLRFLRRFSGPTRECERALLALTEVAQLVDNEGGRKELREALDRAEQRLADAYGRDPGISLRQLDRKTVSDASDAIKGNVWLLEEMAARYLEVHKSVCALRYEESEDKRRVINDLLSMTIATEAPLTSEAAESIRSMVKLVNRELSQIPYPPSYQVSKRWRSLIEYAVRLANRLDDPRHIAYASMAMFDVEIRVLTDDAAEQIAERCRSTYHRANPELKGIGDSPLARPGTTVMVGGVPYSSKTEQGFLFYHEIFTALPEHERTEVVVEIGSGFGRLARIMRLAGRTKCYVLVDLPESLLFAYAFLRVTCPDARTRVIKSAADIAPRMAGEYDFIFCPVQLLAELDLDRVDLVINTYSFGEMTQGCVDHLMHCIHDVLRPRFFYSLNYIFCDKSIHFDSGGLDGEANEIILKLKPEWQLLRLELSSSIGHQGYAVHGSAVLRRSVTRSSRESTDAMIGAASSVKRGSAQWLGCMYLAALWADDPAITDEFFSGLRQFYAESGVGGRAEFDFDNIGEVKVLRRNIAAVAGR